MHTNDVPERELPLIQRSIIDNCFEEGQYEYGIDVLDKLRVEGYKPSPLHIRQLLYISLYPPLPKRREDNTEPIDVPPSPQQVQFQRHKRDLWPKPASRPLAIALLEAFLSTNSPECLMRGLPFYSYTNGEGVKDVDPFHGELIAEDLFEDNSPLKDEVIAIHSLKDCWGLLKNGFVKRKQWDRSCTDENESNQAVIVGPHAWPLLEWMIRIFEKEERRHQANGHVPFSALLLSQIPPPKTRKGPRWDADVPIQVAYACFSPTPHASAHSEKYSSKKRCDLGVRLISSLANLTVTRPPLLSPSHLLRSLTFRLPDLSLSSLQALFCRLPMSQAILKVSLLYSYISLETLPEHESTRKGASLSRPRPKFVGKKFSDDNQSGTEVSTAIQDHKNPYPMPSSSHLFAVLSSPLVSTSDTCDSLLSSIKIALVKFHLVSALYNFHVSRNFEDVRWNTAVQEGQLRQSVCLGFNVNRRHNGSDISPGGGLEKGDEEKEIKSFMNGALEIVDVWEASLSTTQCTFDRQ